MARLNRQNRPSSSQIILIGDLARSTEVSADADAFEDAGSGEELGDGAEGEGVGAGFCGGGAEGGGEEVDVQALVLGDFGEAVVGCCWGGGGGEVGCFEFLEALAVEGCFEVFEGEGVVEDVDWEGMC